MHFYAGSIISIFIIKYNIYNTRARAREGDGTTANDIVEACYYTQLGYSPTPAIKGQIAQMMADGADHSLICAVLEYTAKTAPRPTWAYARSVIERQMVAGSRTADDFCQSVERYLAEKQKKARARVDCYRDGEYFSSRTQWGKRVIEQQYGQREYDPKAYDGLSPEQLAEMAKLDKPNEG